MINWLKENFELLSVGVVGIFGAGGIVHTQSDHNKRIDKLEKKDEQVSQKLTEIHGDIQTLLERTKNL